MSKQGDVSSTASTTCAIDIDERSFESHESAPSSSPSTESRTLSGSKIDLAALAMTLLYFCLFVCISLLSCVKDIAVFSWNRWVTWWDDLVDHWQTVRRVNLDYSHGLYIADSNRA